VAPQSNSKKNREK
jgi:hypothetical protein